MRPFCPGPRHGTLILERIQLIHERQVGSIRFDEVFDKFFVPFGVLFLRISQCQLNLRQTCRGFRIDISFFFQDNEPICPLSGRLSIGLSLIISVVCGTCGGLLRGNPFVCHWLGLELRLENQKRITPERVLPRSFHRSEEVNPLDHRLIAIKDVFAQEESRLKIVRAAAYPPARMRVIPLQLGFVQLVCSLFCLIPIPFKILPL